MDQELSNINRVSLMNVVKYLPIKDQIAVSLTNKEVNHKMRAMPTLRKMEELANFFDITENLFLFLYRRLAYVYLFLLVVITILTCIFRKKIDLNIPVYSTMINVFNIINCFINIINPVDEMTEMRLSPNNRKILLIFWVTQTIFMLKNYINYADREVYMIIHVLFIWSISIEIFKYIRGKLSNNKYKKILINAINGENEIALYVFDRCKFNTNERKIILEKIIRHDNLELFIRCGGVDFIHDDTLKALSSYFTCLEFYEKIYKYDSVSIHNYLSNNGVYHNTEFLEYYQPIKIMASLT